MQILSLIWGVLAVFGMLVGFVPCLGALNWLNIPFAGIGVIVSGIAYGITKDGSRTGSVAGMVCCAIALFFGIIRLVIGGGVL